MNSVISRIHLVPRARSVLFDDGKVNCSLYLSWIYKQTIAWKWTGSLKILQYQYPYLDPYVKQLKHSLHFCVCLILRNRKIGEKKLANCCDSSNSPKFFPLQSFLLYDIFTTKAKKSRDTKNKLYSERNQGRQVSDFQSDFCCSKNIFTFLLQISWSEWLLMFVLNAKKCLNAKK